MFANVLCPFCSQTVPIYLIMDLIYLLSKMLSTRNWYLQMVKSAQTTFEYEKVLVYGIY